MIANVFEVLARELDAYFLNAPRRQFHKLKDGLTDRPTEGEIEPDPQGGLGAGFSDFTDSDPSVNIIQFLRQEDQQEFIKFPLNRVIPVLINIEEENNLRPADRFARTSPTGKTEKSFPDIRINLYILFVAHFYDYTDALHYISLIIRYFQSRPIIDHQNTPELNEEIDRLLIELITLPFSEQNEVWNAMRSAYHPSVLYKVKMLVFQDQSTHLQSPEVSKLDVDSSIS